MLDGDSAAAPYVAGLWGRRSHTKNVGDCLAGSGRYRGWLCERTTSSRLYDSTGYRRVRVLEGGGGLHREENAGEDNF